MIVAKMSHGGVALRDASTGRLLRWLIMTSGTPTGVQVDGEHAIVTFADGKQSTFDLNTGELEP
jgi:hypothetical protein